MNPFLTASTVAVTLACLWGFYEIATDVRTSEAIARFDTVMTAAIQSFRSPGLDLFMKFMTYAGGTIGVTTFTLALVLYLRSQGRPGAATFAGTLVIGGTILAGFFKSVMRRVRPHEALALINMPSSSSFPSGHSMASMSLAIAVMQVAVFSPAIGWFGTTLVVVGAVLYALLVGVSRVYLGVHWPSDVVAAWLLAGAWVFGAISVNRLFLQDVPSATPAEFNPQAH